MNKKAEVSWFMVSMIFAVLVIIVGVGMYFSPLKVWNKVTNECEESGIGVCMTDAACNEDTGVVMTKSCNDDRVCCLSESAGAGGSGGAGSSGGSMSAGSVSFDLTVDGEPKTTTRFQMTAGADHAIAVNVNGENMDNRLCAITFLYRRNDGTKTVIPGTRQTFQCDIGIRRTYRLDATYVQYSPIDFDFVAFPTMTADWNALSDSAKFYVTLNPLTTR